MKRKRVMRDDAPRARINDYDNASSDELIFQGLSPAEITTTHHKTDENTNTPSLEAEVVTTETEEHEPLSNDPFEEDATMANPDPSPSTLEEVEPTMIPNEDHFEAMDAIPCRPQRNRRPPVMLNYDSLGNPADFQPYVSSI